MTKKANPISDHKHEDVALLRKSLLEVIATKTKTAAEEKNRLYAMNLLARIHGVKGESKPVKPVGKSSTIKLSAEEQERIDKILNE